MRERGRHHTASTSSHHPQYPLRIESRVRNRGESDEQRLECSSPLYRYSVL
jgi:hypothetical protein